MKLYEITEQYREALDELATFDISQEEIADTLSALHGDLSEKAKAVAAMALNLEAEAAAANEHAKRLATRGKSLQKKSDSLRAYLLEQMQRAAIDKFDDPVLPISVCKNPVSVWLDDDAVPDEWRSAPKKPAPDKRAIKEALSEGALECNWARLERSSRVKIGA